MHESREMYLETILILKKEIDQVRSVDIAKKLNFSKASVSRAIRLLKDDNYIYVGDNGFIQLTKKGQEKSKYIYEKHKVLTDFLTKIIKVSPEIAEEDACRIEHCISDDSFNGIKKYLENELKK